MTTFAALAVNLSRVPLQKSQNFMYIAYNEFD